MIRSRRIQLVILTLAAGGTLALLTWAIGDAVFKLREGPQSKDLIRARNAYLEVADRTTRTAINFTELLAKVSSTGDTNGMSTIQQVSRDFSTWISTQRTVGSSSKIIYIYPASLTVDLGSTLDRIDELNRQIASQATSASDGLALCRQLLALAGETSARAESINQFVSLTKNLRQAYVKLVLIAVIVLGSASVWLVYRMASRPLRRRLTESRQVIEQQQKLAHFGKLAANLAHEIRNPLTAINARLYTLQKSLPARAPAVEDAAVIHGEINRLDHIVNDFLRLARPAEPKITAVHARPLMQQVSQLLSPALQERGIELIVDATVETPFRADAQQIKQVLINLVQNAGDAINENGVITLSASFALQKLRGESQEVVILEVKDTGPGIPAHVRERLFDPFYSTKKEGSGLGLAISQRIVDQHGGEIVCDSDLGRGTSFGIVLPVKGEQ